MKYFVYVENAHGCDYTIGCNRGLFELKGNTAEEAVEWFYQNAIEFIDSDDNDHQRYYTDDPTEMRHVMFLEVTHADILSNDDVDKIKADYLAIKQKQKEVVEESAERAEYKRLQGKFGAP